MERKDLEEIWVERGIRGMLEEGDFLYEVIGKITVVRLRDFILLMREKENGKKEIARVYEIDNDEMKIEYKGYFYRENNSKKR